MRAGSQRVKDKNIRRINNKPLYSYILETLLNSIYINKIVINTDILLVKQQYKANNKIIIIKREKNLKGNCSMNLVIEDTLKKIKGDVFVQVHATNPLLKTETIDKAIEEYQNNIPAIDSLFSVTKVQKRLWNIDGIPLNHNPKESPTTQDLEPIYEENSCCYIFSRESFNKNNNRIGNSPLLFQTDLLESFDIDSEEEFHLIERILS